MSSVPGGDPRFPSAPLLPSVPRGAGHAPGLRAAPEPPLSPWCGWRARCCCCCSPGACCLLCLTCPRSACWHRWGCQYGCVSTFPSPPRAMFPYPAAHPGPETKGRWEPTYFCKSNLEFSSGNCPVTGCRKVFRLSLWLQDTMQWALLAPRKGEDGVQGCIETQRGAAHPPVQSRELHPSLLTPQIALLLAPFCCSGTRALLCFLHHLHRLSPALPRLHSPRQQPE